MVRKIVSIGVISSIACVVSGIVCWQQFMGSMSGDIRLVYGAICCVNTDGKIVIDPKFDTMPSFHNGFAWVAYHLKNEKPSSRQAYINREGREIKFHKLVKGGKIGNRIEAIRSADSFEEQFGCVDEYGNIVVPFGWQAGTTFEGKVAVMKKQVYPAPASYSLFNNKGKKFFETTEFEPVNYGGGLIALEEIIEHHGQKRVGYLDMDGKWAIEPRLGLVAANFSAGAVPMLGEDGKFGLIDRAGTVVAEPTFDRIGEFSEGLASYQKGEQQGYIDNRGTPKIVLNGGSIRLGEFHEGLAKIETNGGCSYINQAGAEMIGKISCTSATDFSDGRAIITRDYNNYGFINHAGKYVLAPSLFAAMPFSEGLAAVVFRHPLTDDERRIPRTVYRVE